MSLNIDQYKTEHECDEHWQLRKKFLLAHCDKFPEDELVCLAQVFVNVEFLGCRYPKETMRLVAELSRDVAKDFREKQKSKLQRTFVKASDAATSKAQGFRNPPEKHCAALGNQANQATSSKQNETRKIPFKRSLSLPTKKEIKIEKQRKLMKTVNAPYGNLVLFDHGEKDTPPGIISRAATSQGASVEWKYEKGETCKCIIIYNSNKLAEGYGTSDKIAKKEASMKGVEELRKYYYTIKVKKSLIPTIEGGIATNTSDPIVSESLADDNIGRKMMKLMGWTGGGLGKSSQGITEPVTVQQQLSRKGLGLKSGTNLNFFRRKCQQILSNWVQGDTKVDLVFTPEFTNEERAVVHQIAQRMGVKSQSHGPKDHRTLIISRKIDPLELVTELKELGGITDKYELINPTIDD